MSWEVRPRLKVSPPGLVLRPSPHPIRQTILVESDGRPFRIQEIACPLLAEAVGLPRQAATRHQLTVTLDASHGPTDRAVDVRIRTDHPDQRAASLTVMVIAGSGGT